MIHSDRGYEEDPDGGEGDTTDEELVGENDLPQCRVRPSPGPRSRRPLTGILSSPTPADILAGRVFWESDKPDDVDDTLGRALQLSTDSGWRSGDPSTSTVTDYGKMIRASPFTAMHDMLASSSSSLPRRSRKKRVNQTHGASFTMSKHGATGYPVDIPESMRTWTGCGYGFGRI